MKTGNIISRVIKEVEAFISKRPFEALGLSGLIVGCTIKWYDARKNEEKLNQYKSLLEKEDARITALSHEAKVCRENNDYLILLLKKVKENIDS